jgi:AraC-like DNA-binding protein
MRGIAMSRTVFSVLNEKEARFPYGVYGAGIDQNQKHLIRSNGFPAVIWLQTRKGNGRIVIGDKEHELGVDQGVWIMPNEPHEMYPDEGDWIVDWVGLIGEQTQEIMKNILQINKTGVYEVTDGDILHDLIVGIADLEESDTVMKEYDQTVRVYEFLVNFARVQVLSSHSSLKSRYDRIKPIFDYIDKHYHESITLKQLADLLDVTPQHLCTLFRKIMKTRIFEFINLVRIQKSKEQLVREPETSIRDIAHNNGFEDVSYFCYIFKRLEKITPGEFRKLNVH